MPVRARLEARPYASMPVRARRKAALRAPLLARPYFFGGPGGVSLSKMSLFLAM
jgi:hypothetical protein